MQFETFMLRSLFVACFAVSALTLGAMLHARPQTPSKADAHTIASTLLAAPTACAMKPDGVICPTQHG